MSVSPEPQIELAGLKIWVHARQFPDLEDYWDGNWIIVTVHCHSPGADVWIRHNPCVHLPELEGWRDAVADMRTTLSGKAKLDCMEPYLRVDLTMQTLGHILMEVQITPNNVREEHKFKFEIDQNYLDLLLTQCSAVLAEYAIRGERPVPR